MKEQLTRSGSDKMIAGVCGGVARSFGIDASIVRIIWAVLSLFFTGLPVVLYAVLWLVLPVDGNSNSTGFDDLKNAFSTKPQA
jgi:phage shock protein PspC (stress-responsive transcriptional regulator)